MKVFASDLDGTLFFHDLPLGHKEKDILRIKQFQKDGNLFGCCTGRSLDGARISFVDLLDLDFYIASSGAVVTDNALNILYGCPIPFESAKKLCEEYKERVTIYIQTLHYYTFNKELENEYFTALDALDQIKDEPIYSVCLISEDPEVIKNVADELKDNYADLVGYQNISAVDVVAKGCSKGAALKKVKEIFKAETSYGIGDSYNDIPLLDDADVSFTFHSSVDEVKSHANYMVNSVEEAIDFIQ